MNRSAWLRTTVLCAASATAWGHAHLTRSEPAEGSTVEPPAQIVLSFSESARLTQLTLQREGAQPQKLPAPAEAAARQTLPLSTLAAGSYTLTWRALGSDGHVTSGAVHFSVRSSVDRPQPTPHDEH